MVKPQVKQHVKPQLQQSVWQQAVHAQKIWVWDITLRLGHWLLAICFATAYATGDSESWRLWHVYSGSGVLGIVCFRVLWGFIGTPYARFSSFIHHPSQALRYLSSLLRGKPEHHIGHNPAGGWAVIGLLSLSAITALTGWLVYQGNAPHWQAQAHEIASSLTFLLVAVHIAAVIISSKAHRENLVKTMVLGYQTEQMEQSSELAMLKNPKNKGFGFKKSLVGLLLLVAICVTTVLLVV